MKILVIGKSAREHAFIQKITTSPKAEKIYCVPGNPAIAQYAECVNIPLEDITSMVEFAKENEIDLTIALGEYVIQNGITNIFRQKNLKIFAPTMEAAQIGTSRAFAKKFLHKNKIPTTKYGVFDKEASAIDYIKKAQYPLIIKYDHLANQDSFICKSFSQAKNTINKVFYDVQKKVIVEEYLEGEVITLSILTDGYNVLPLPYVKEYKKNLDGDDGVLTKGVGAYCPATKISAKLENSIANDIVFPLLDAMQELKTPYEGFLSMQLLLLPNGDILVLEFLPTLSIPDATCVFQLIENDLLEIIYLASEGALEDNIEFSISNETVASVALKSGNYPDNPKLNSIINGIENLDEDNIELYYNDVGINSEYEIVTTGGRAFFITSKASTLNNAVRNLYDNIDTITFDGKNYRRDIGTKYINYT